MRLEVHRFSYTPKYTLGLFYIDDKFECFTLEDTFREVKIPKETCIPYGTFEVKLRTEGTHNEEYAKKFPDIHKGMLHLQDVPNFQYILIHIGNSNADSEGCILVGNQSVKSGSLVDSTNAYKELYKKIAPVLIKGEKVTIKIS